MISRDCGGGGVFNAVDSQNAAESPNVADLSLRRTATLAEECGKNPTSNLTLKFKN